MADFFRASGMKLGRCLQCAVRAAFRAPYVLPMPSSGHPCSGHSDPHAFMFMNPRERDGVVVRSRRSVLKTSLAGLGGLTLPALMKLRAEGKTASNNKSVILLWMTGGPSHIDTWDPKVDRPREIRGPFKTIPTKLPGTHICEYLPKQAAMLDKFTLIRSVDCRFSNHEPNMVMQTANLANEPRTNPKAKYYPSFGSIVAKHHGANHPAMPPYVVLNLKSRSHVAWGGYLGTQYDPFNGSVANKLFQLPTGLTMERLHSRHTLSQQMDGLRAELDASGMMTAMDSFGQKAYDIVAGGRAQEAFDVSKEPQKVLDRYGEHDWARQALLARRLVERGSSFVTIDLSNHSASGTWDNHGDNIPPYGRSPTLGTQGSTDGRNHWPYVMSMSLAGGGFRHGQVIGASSKDGGEISERPVTPGDLAATIYHHMGVPLDATYTDHQGRPNFIVDQGAPLPELV